jgi:hypothetical protein
MNSKSLILNLMVVIMTLSCTRDEEPSNVAVVIAVNDSSSSERRIIVLPERGQGFYSILKVPLASLRPPENESPTIYSISSEGTGEIIREIVSLNRNSKPPFDPGGPPWTFYLIGSDGNLLDEKWYDKSSDGSQIGIILEREKSRRPISSAEAHAAVVKLKIESDAVRRVVNIAVGSKND